MRQETKKGEPDESCEEVNGVNRHEFKHLYSIPDGQLEQQLASDMFIRLFLDRDAVLLYTMCWCHTMECMAMISVYSAENRNRGR